MSLACDWGRVLAALLIGGGCQRSGLVDPPHLVLLALAPPDTTIDESDSLRFRVAGQWSDGQTTTPLVTWSADGGTIDATGLYRALVAPGPYQITAREVGGPLQADARVTVRSRPPAGGGLPNECAAPKAGWIWCDDFDQNRLSSYFEFDGAGGSFALVAGVGSGGSSGMRTRFAKGQVSAGSLKLAFGRTPAGSFRPVDGGTADYRELYWRFYFRTQPGWTGGGGDKLSRMTVFATGAWAQAMIAHVWSASSPNQSYLALDPASGTDPVGNLRTTVYNDFPNLRWLGVVRGNTGLFDGSHVGSWYCIESRVRLNDAGQSNGAFELWVNGGLEARAPNLNWLGGYAAFGLNAVLLENYWNAGSPATQERYFDNFVVSTQPIGC